MSDLMLLGVLRMPLDTTSDLMMEQFIDRARRAADRIESDADEIASLRQQLEQAQARIAELEADNVHQRERRNAARECIKKMGDGSAWLLRKQAEAVENLGTIFPSIIKRVWSGSEIIDWLQSESQRLRQQAGEIEKAGGGQ